MVGCSNSVPSSPWTSICTISSDCQNGRKPLDLWDSCHQKLKVVGIPFWRFQWENHVDSRHRLCTYIQTASTAWGHLPSRHRNYCCKCFRCWLCCHGCAFPPCLFSLVLAWSTTHCKTSRCSSCGFIKVCMYIYLSVFLPGLLWRVQYLTALLCTTLLSSQIICAPRCSPPKLYFYLTLIAPVMLIEQNF